MPPGRTVKTSLRRPLQVCRPNTYPVSLSVSGISRARLRHGRIDHDYYKAKTIQASLVLFSVFTKDFAQGDRRLASQIRVAFSGLGEGLQNLSKSSILYSSGKLTPPLLRPCDHAWPPDPSLPTCSMSYLRLERRTSNSTGFPFVRRT
jgi:hypothetical protein